MSLFKNMLFGERWRGQFRIEAYNALNHTQFTTVNTSATYSLAALRPTDYSANTPLQAIHGNCNWLFV